MSNETKTELPELMDLAGKRVTVMGLGTFGGGVGAARFCAQQGAQVTVTDLRSAEQLGESVDALDGLPVTMRLGEHVETDFTDTDLVIASPAVPRDSQYLQAASFAGIPVSSEMNLFMARCAGKVVGVSGSNGKSTTATLIAHLLEGSGRRVWLGGNIGVSLLADVHEIAEDDAVVLELSSFQLDDLHKLQKSPTVAVLLNLTPNHLDRHGSFEHYVAAKLSLFCYQQPKNITILNYEDVRVEQLKGQVAGRLAMFSNMRHVAPGAFIQKGEFAVDLGTGPKMCGRVRDLPLLGKHNEQNVLGAILAASVLKTPPEEIEARLKTFAPLPHRLEPVGTFDEVKFINDSKATTPEAAISAIGAMNDPFWLIAGGKNKGLDYSELASAIVRSKAAGVLGIGEMGEEFVGMVRKINAHRQRPKKYILENAGTLAAAIDRIKSVAQPGDVVLLSPASASYDQFADFEERGDHFKSLVRDFARTPGEMVDTSAHQDAAHSISRVGKRTREEMGEVRLPSPTAAAAHGRINATNSTQNVPTLGRPGVQKLPGIAPTTAAARAAAERAISGPLPVAGPIADASDSEYVPPPTPMSMPSIEEESDSSMSRAFTPSPTRGGTMFADNAFVAEQAAAGSDAAFPADGLPLDTAASGIGEAWGDFDEMPVAAEPVMADTDWGEDPFANLTGGPADFGPGFGAPTPTGPAAGATHITHVPMAPPGGFGVVHDPLSANPPDEPPEEDLFSLTDDLLAPLDPNSNQPMQKMRVRPAPTERLPQRATAPQASAKARQRPVSSTKPLSATGIASLKGDAPSAPLGGPTAKPPGKPQGKPAAGAPEGEDDPWPPGW